MIGGVVHHRFHPVEDIPDFQAGLADRGREGNGEWAVRRMPNTVERDVVRSRRGDDDRAVAAWAYRGESAGAPMGIASSGQRRDRARFACIEHDDRQSTVGLLHRPQQHVVDRHQVSVVVIVTRRYCGVGRYQEIPATRPNAMTGVVDQCDAARRDRLTESANGRQQLPLSRSSQGCPANTSKPWRSSALEMSAASLPAVSSMPQVRSPELPMTSATRLRCSKGSRLVAPGKLLVYRAEQRERGGSILGIGFAKQGIGSNLRRLPGRSALSLTAPGHCPAARWSGSPAVAAGPVDHPDHCGQHRRSKDSAALRPLTITVGFDWAIAPPKGLLSMTQVRRIAGRYLASALLGAVPAHLPRRRCGSQGPNSISVNEIVQRIIDDQHVRIGAGQRRAA